MHGDIRKNIERHISLSDAEFEHFLTFMTARKLRKRQYLVQQGDHTHYSYYVVKGCLRAFKADNSGKEHIIQFALEDWWIGDMAALTTGTPARLNIECLEDCDILQIHYEDQERLYAELPKFERFFRIIIQNSLVATQNRLLSVMSQPAYDRYLEFMERYPKVVQRVANHHIASYLGIAPESLSRLRKEGTMRSDRSKS
ncbi:MAG: Crp/Fnr family transcriptional regulator [Saprospiraceae bacterium]|nr:Crp/Fnr family transcriptional regulator [Saprospiraceae bacterium]